MKKKDQGKPVSMDYKEMFEAMMRSTEDSLFFKDRECRFTYVSDSQLRHLNETDMSKVIGKSDSDFFSKEHAERTYACEQKVMETGIAVLGTEEHTTFADGTIRWNKLSNYPLYDRDHNIIGTWGISTDITAQKNVEHQLMEKEEHYRILSDVTIEGIVIHKKGVIKDVNPSFLKLLGYKMEEVLGRDLLDYIHEEDRPLVREKISNKMENPYEIRFVRKNGTQFFAEIEGRTIKIPGEDLRMAAIRDITMRKEAERALMESETRMRAITDSAHDAILMMDPDGNISYWNPAAERIFGYSRSEAIGKKLHQFIVPSRYLKAHEAAFPFFQKTGQGGAVGKTVDMEARRKDNTEIPVQLSLSAVQLSNGWHSVGILRDITGQKKNELELIKAKEEAEEATGAKSEFLANMSHEIRTPMNAIIGFSGLIQKTEMTSKQKDYINKIESSAKSLLGIINDILDFSKIEAGKLELESVEFRLDDVINNIVSMNCAKAAEKDIELLNDISNDVPLSLVGDPLRFGQILLNLINNAVKFTNEGHVLVKTELIKKDGSRCTIKFSVKDTGIGLTQDQKEKLFTAFLQADSSVTRRFGGTGLGLTISKQLVEMMNGEIFVESEFGVGSTFSFIIDFKVQSYEKIKQINDRNTFRNIKALIVDDNELSREILKDQIEAFGIRSAVVDSGAAAIAEIKEKSKSNPYDLVFMDWRMPVMNGIEAAKIILKDKSLKNMPKIIMLSAFGREEVVKQAERIGIKAFLIKPVTQSLLFDTILNVSEVAGKDYSATVQANQKCDIVDDMNGIKILLVEDNAMNQEVASEILGCAGAAVDIANNGKEAVSAVKSSAYDIILMDLQMPVMGGYEATKNIRLDDKLKDLPIIAMTAHAMQGVKEECIAAGMNDYISKPIEPEHLFAVIKKWAKRTGGGKRPAKAAVAPEKQEAIVLPKSGFGVDIESGLGRLNGNRKLYRKLLLDFSKNYTSSPDDLHRLLQQGNLEDARRLAHTLKGVAGNISAYDIQAIAAEIEIKIQNHPSGIEEKLNKKLEAAFAAYNQLLSGIAETMENDEPEDIEKTINPSEVEPVLQELARLVWEDNVDAGRLLEELKGRIYGTKFAQDMQILTECIDNFEFEAAKVPLQNIAKEMNINIGDQSHE